MVTIRDLARISGYSVSMISRVLNEQPYVSDEKRQAILALIKEYNYIPNNTARQLSWGQTKNIGVLVPYVNQPYFDQLINGILTTAFAYGYKVTLLPTNYDPAAEKQYLADFAAKAYDGLIITSKSSPAAVFLAYQQYGPIVFCEAVAEEQAACVFIDREQAFAEVCRFMQQQGVRKIGLTISRDEKQSATSQMMLKTAQRYFTIEPALIQRNCSNYADGCRAGAYFAQNHQLEGVFTNGDEIAAGVYQAYEDQQRPLLVGQENLLVSQLLNFSSIYYPVDQWGRLAFELFYQRQIAKRKIAHTFIPRLGH